MKKESFIDYLKMRKYWFLTNMSYLFCKDDKKRVKKQFKKHHGYDLNFENPVHIDEKFSINKFRDDSLLKKQLSDKISVRDYITKLGLERILINPFYSYENINDIDFSKFTEPMIIKCSNNSGLAYKYIPGQKVDKWRLRTLKFLSKQNYYKCGREKNYDGLKGRFLAEKIIGPKDGVLFDYKFFCFDGEIGFVFIEQGISNENGNHSKYFRRNIVDEKYNEIKGASESRKSTEFEKLIKPSNWEDMCECAKVISKEFNFVRVDLYSVDGKTFFGETTFYHRAGNANYQPESFDIEFAKKIKVVNNEPGTKKDRRI